MYLQFSVQPSQVLTYPMLQKSSSLFNIIIRKPLPLTTTFYSFLSSVLKCSLFYAFTIIFFFSTIFHLPLFLLATQLQRRNVLLLIRNIFFSILNYSIPLSVYFVQQRTLYGTRRNNFHSLLYFIEFACCHCYNFIFTAFQRRKILICRNENQFAAGLSLT